ncbi:MAG: generic methyl-transferase [Neisseria sp.]|nr:generic methyl-transferase [Neisseria sp.]
MEYGEWFENSSTGRYAAACELDFFQRQTAETPFQTALQTSLPQWLLSGQALCNGRDLFADAAALPFPACSMGMLLLPHTLEETGAYRETLKEAYRVLQDEGLMVLTGFNPHSVWRILYRAEGKSLPGQSGHITFHELKSAVSEAGFDLAATEWLACWPAVENGRPTTGWPAVAMIYGITAVKQRAGVHPLQEELPAAVQGLGGLALGGI